MNNFSFESNIVEYDAQGRVIKIENGSGHFNYGGGHTESYNINYNDETNEMVVEYSYSGNAGTTFLNNQCTMTFDENGELINKIGDLKAPWILKPDTQ